MPESNMPKCPRCNSSRRVYADFERDFWCTSCHMGFDDNPDEGGDYSTDPTRRIEREEAQAVRTSKRRFAARYGPRKRLDSPTQKR